MSAVMKPQPSTATANDAPASGEGSAKTDETTDGFHLVIDALKLNGIDTIFGLPGIPITDLAAHGAGRRHARDLVPPRAARRQRRRRRRLPDAASRASASPSRRPASSTA